MVMRISTNRQQETGGRQSGGSSPGLELWLKDGDQALVQIVSSGDPADNPSEVDSRIDDFYIHTIQSTSDSGGRAFKQFLCEPLTYETDDDCEHCADNKNPGHQFGMWCYVYYILHNEQRQDDWEEVQNRGGVTRYKQTVNNFMVFAKGFGRGDYLWNQVSDIYNEQEGLNNFQTRIKRNGSGLRDTSYVIASTNAKAEWPDDLLDRGGQLPTIKDFFSRKYGAVKADAEELLDVSAVSVKDEKTPAVSKETDIADLLDDEDLF